MRQDKIVHVRFKDESIPERDYYCGSIAAIYSILTPEQIGIKESSLRAALTGKRIYKNKKVEIKASRLVRSPHKHHL